MLQFIIVLGAGYPMAGYTAKKAEKNAESGDVGFVETVAEKTA